MVQVKRYRELPIEKAQFWGVSKPNNGRRGELFFVKSSMYLSELCRC